MGIEIKVIHKNIPILLKKYFTFHAFFTFHSFYVSLKVQIFEGKFVARIFTSHCPKILGIWLIKRNFLFSTQNNSLSFDIPGVFFIAQQIESAIKSIISF